VELRPRVVVHVILDHVHEVILDTLGRSIKVLGMFRYRSRDSILPVTLEPNGAKLHSSVLRHVLSCR